MFKGLYYGQKIDMYNIMSSTSSPNPMIQPIYNIYESPLWPTCSNLYPVSRITKQSDEENKLSDLFSKKGPMSIIEVEQYLSTETSKLLTNIKLANQCDMALLSLNKNIKSPVPDSCSSTFKNFSKSQIENVKKNIIAKTGDYVSDLDNSPFDNISYTDEYIQSKMTDNDKKPLCQRYADILQMLTDFVNILKSMNNPDITNKYIDHYQEIMKIFQQNNNLRKDLEKKLTSIYGENSLYDDSKKFLDSTIYVSVLWTVLATTALFYIFKKM
jgi:hypothetical protein